MKRKTSRTAYDLGADAAPVEPARGESAALATVAVQAAESEKPIQRRAAQLAAQLGLPLVHTGDPSYPPEKGDRSLAGEHSCERQVGRAGDQSPSSSDRYDMLLTVTAERLELRFPQRGGPGPLYVDFVDGPLGYARRGNLSGLLVKAVGFRSGRLTVLDATAGLGRDAFRLAYHGCRVTAIERSPILFALLQDGLERAARVPEIHERLGDRLRLLHGDARSFLQQVNCGTGGVAQASSLCDPPALAGGVAQASSLCEPPALAGVSSPEDAPDVVYLDPMFPPKKKSALVKVEMRILHRLVGDDPDAGELFDLACAIARRRVVVKRHRLAEPLAPHPTHSHRDQTTRYDVYLRPIRP